MKRSFPQPASWVLAKIRKMPRPDSLPSLSELLTEEIREKCSDSGIMAFVEWYNENEEAGHQEKMYRFVWGEGFSDEDNKPKLMQRKDPYGKTNL